jgi:hypothetical protein
MDAKQPGADVDLDGLRMVADLLRAGIEKSWRPGAIRANLELDHGVRFGLASPGGQIAAARAQFGVVLDQALGNMARQLEAVESLARHIETLLANQTAGVTEPTARGHEELEPLEGWA